MSPLAIVEEVAASHCLGVSDLASRSRRRDLVLARAEAAYRLRLETDLRLWQIGQLLGGRTHATVIHLAQMHDLRLMVGMA